MAVLTELEAERGDFFAKLMARCCAISTDHVDDNDSLYHVASAEDQVLGAILDTPSWAVLVGLVDQCPVVPRDAGREAPGRRALRVSTDIEFISENRQIAWARRFLESLPSLLASR